LLARHRREPFEKVIDRVPRFNVIEQSLHRNSCAVENCGAAHHLGTAADNWMFHATRLHPYPPGVQATVDALGVRNSAFDDQGVGDGQPLEVDDDRVQVDFVDLVGVVGGEAGEGGDQLGEGGAVGGRGAADAVEHGGAF
jgi:hypothetical protein